ncbi:MAG: VWA domain-containing protein [Chloroflexota bacterium]
MSEPEQPQQPHRSKWWKLLRPFRRSQSPLVEPEELGAQVEPEEGLDPERPKLGQLWELFDKLRRRHRFPLEPDDYQALRQALRLGFGWSSKEALRELCCTLWAKSLQEREILVALFDQMEFSDWELPRPETEVVLVGSNIPAQTQAPKESDPTPVRRGVAAPSQGEVLPTTQEALRLPTILLSGVNLPERPFVFVPQLPLTYREIAQTWRRLRRPVRQGPATELDVEATIARRCHTGVASPIVLVSRRRNTARLLLLIDQQGSMTPVHRLSEEFCSAIQRAGRMEQVAIYYFHDTPAEGADRTALEPLADQLFPVLDSVLTRIVPLEEGHIYSDSQLSYPQALPEILRQFASGASVIILSDGGAARGRYDLLRLLDTVAFLKALRQYASGVVWLNPLPRRYWAHTTAAQIARHVAMFSLDVGGMNRAVDVLRGQPYNIERPV